MIAGEKFDFTESAFLEEFGKLPVVNDMFKITGKFFVVEKHDEKNKRYVCRTSVPRDPSLTRDTDDFKDFLGDPTQIEALRQYIAEMEEWHAARKRKDDISKEISRGIVGESAERMLRERYRMLEQLAVAFVDKTGLQPDECELVEQRTGNKTTWHFRKRVQPDDVQPDAIVEAK